MLLKARGLFKKEVQEIKKVKDLQQEKQAIEIDKLITKSSKLREALVYRNTLDGEIICFQVKPKDFVFWIDESGKRVEQYISYNYTKVFPKEFCISVLVPSDKDIDEKYIAKEFVKKENALLRKLLKEIPDFKKGIITFRYKPVPDLHQSEEGTLFVEQLTVAVWK